MSTVSESVQKELPRLLKLIEQSCDYDAPNYKRYRDVTKFILENSVTNSEQSYNETLDRPNTSFNVLEAYASRQMGEFSKQEPSIEVTSANDQFPVNSDIIEFLQGHIRYLLSEANDNSFEYTTQRQNLIGGFSVMRVWTEYMNEMSFAQNIRLGNANPLYVGFSPTAKLPTKSDGDYCFNIYPVLAEEAEERYGIDITKIKFAEAFGDFQWTYQSAKQKIILFCDFYEKKKKKTKIVYLSNHQEITLADYKKYLQQWELAGEIEQPAQIVKSRWTTLVSICQYTLCPMQIVDYTETDLSDLPLIRVAGNPAEIYQNDSKTVQEVLRSYFYNAIDAQRMKNFAGQSWLAYIEGMVQHKYKVAKESIPTEDDYQAAYKNLQKANTMVYNAYLNYDPTSNTPPIPIPAPAEIPLVPMPQEIMAAFDAADKTIQMILGSYDAALGVNDNQLSGVAIVEGATQSNAAAMPYLVSFMQALNQAATIILDLIPKYYVTPRTVPVIGSDGKKAFVKINQEGGLKIEYTAKSLNVKVKAGVNYAIQKNRTLNMITGMMRSSPQFANFINTECLPFIIKHMDFPEVDQITKMAEDYVEKQQQQQKMAQQAQMQAQQQGMMNNPMMLKAKNEQMKIQMDAQQDQAENQLRSRELDIDQQSANNDTMQISIDAQNAHQSAIADLAKSEAEKTAKAADLMMSAHDMDHKHRMDKVDMAHTLMQSAIQNEAQQQAQASQSQAVPAASDLAAGGPSEPSV